MTPLLEDPALARGWPCAELHHTDSKISIDVEAPGWDPADLEVELTGHTLTVHGTPHDGSQVQPFVFIFELPGDANLDRLHALFDEGLLLITAPRLRRLAKRSIPIEIPHLIHAEASGC